MKLEVFFTWEEFRTVCDPGKLPGISNENFALDMDGREAQSLFLRKMETGVSLLALLEEEAKEENAAWARQVLEFYENQRKQGKLTREGTGMENMLSLLECFTDDKFIGALFFHIPVIVKRMQNFGAPYFTKNARFEAAFVRVDGRAEHGKEASCIFQGQILGRQQALGQIRSFNIEAFFSGGRLVLVTGDCQILPVGLFGEQSARWEPFKLHGVYTGGNYQFALQKEVNYGIYNSLLRSVSIETAAASMNQDESGAVLTVSCGGRLRFERLSDCFDPFGYGPDSLKEDGYIFYDNLKMNICLDDGLKISFHYRGMVLREAGAKLRKTSLWQEFPHGNPEFLCWQKGSTPADAGFHGIQVPAKQKTLGKEWYGLVFPLTICGGVSLKLLFAFSERSFFAGSNLVGNGSSAGLNFALNELWSIRCSTVALLPCEMPGGRKSALLHLKGIRVSLFGLTFPPDACSIVFLARGNQKELGWYAVYGKGRKGEEINGNEGLLPVCGTWSHELSSDFE